MTWERHLMVTYNLTPEHYWALYESQDGHCAFCPRNGKHKKLSVDHDHKCCSGAQSCGKCVRGLLCRTCNVYLGHIRDNPEAGLAIHDYLRNPPAPRVFART